MLSQRGETGGPNAPLPWILQTILSLIPPSERSHQPSKILMGLNFYGTQFSEEGASHILGLQYAQALSMFKPKLIWDSTASEHYFTYEYGGKTYTAYYPTLKVRSHFFLLIKFLTGNLISLLPSPLMKDSSWPVN